MNVIEHVNVFAGLPIISSSDAEPDDPAAVGWRVALDEFDGTPEEFEAAFERVLSRAGDGGPIALVLGEWGESYERQCPVDLLLRNAARMPRLRALFLGDLEQEECEISWINHTALGPLLDAFPRLEHLGIRGATGLTLEPFRHESLRELTIQSGGLPAPVIRAIGASDLPRLEHLELWLGVSAYGGDARADDLAPILTGRSLPALTSLGVCNAEIADEVAAAVAAAPVVARLRRLDLSKGAMTDAGGEALLTGQPLTHLESLDLQHHFLTEELAQRLVDELPGVRVDTAHRQEEREWGRYTAVAE